MRDPQELGRQPLVITSVGGRIVIGYGEQAAKQAVAKRGPGTLADNPTFKSATGALRGMPLSAYVSLSKIFDLADALGSLRDPDYVRARPYLDHLSYAAIGSGKQGDTSTSRIVVGVKPG